MSTRHSRETRGMVPVGFEAPRTHIDKIERALAARRTRSGQKVTKAMLYRYLLEKFATDKDFQKEILADIQSRETTTE